MNFLNWGLSAIDTIFSTKSAGADAESHCPGSSNPAGYVKDSYGKWQPLCLTELSIEDSEDLFIFWLQVASTLLIATAVYLVHRKIKKTASAQDNGQRRPDVIMDIARCVQTQSCKLDDIARSGQAQACKLDIIAARVEIIAARQATQNATPNA